ncbi:ClpXP protease specificity-enhancing factor SspB [Fastidiosibacter lacustris]|uniref:ClpXP protease specificity-enhancing factor SspB n=1 Tax=Fastidiosibacter lacustris TaxID=2056695 RepID=UPI000E343391|nr:ClpXP protease specificity-enhancing factor SspB [Fastidiosibacter lacustris]
MAMLRAYLIEATYDWMLDHNLTPYLLVDSEYENMILPENHVDEDGKILLNISPEAIEHFGCDDQFVRFDATFDGEMMSLQIPVEAVLELYSGETSQGLYAREFGYGIDVNEGNSEEEVNPPKCKSQKGSGGLHLV